MYSLSSYGKFLYAYKNPDACPSSTVCKCTWVHDTAHQDRKSHLGGIDDHHQNRLSRQKEMRLNSFEKFIYHELHWGTLLHWPNFGG